MQLLFLYHFLLLTEVVVFFGTTNVKQTTTRSSDTDQGFFFGAVLMPCNFFHAARASCPYCALNPRVPLPPFKHHRHVLLLVAGRSPFGPLATFHSALRCPDSGLGSRVPRQILLFPTRRYCIFALNVCT